MTGSTTEVAPCPNISLGWPCPWARRRAASGQARYGARQYRGGGVPVGGGGVSVLVAPRPTDLATARAVVVPLPDPCLYPNPLPVHPPPPLRVASTSRCSFLGGMGCGTCRGQAERALDRSFAAIRKLHAMYSRGRRRWPAAGLTARPSARSD